MKLPFYGTLCIVVKGCILPFVLHISTTQTLTLLSYHKYFAFIKGN